MIGTVAQTPDLRVSAHEGAVSFPSANNYPQITPEAWRKPHRYISIDSGRDSQFVTYDQSGEQYTWADDVCNHPATTEEALELADRIATAAVRTGTYYILGRPKNEVGQPNSYGLFRHQGKDVDSRYNPAALTADDRQIRVVLQHANPFNYTERTALDLYKTTFSRVLQGVQPAAEGVSIGNHLLRARQKVVGFASKVVRYTLEGQPLREEPPTGPAEFLFYRERGRAVVEAYRQQQIKLRGARGIRINNGPLQPITAATPLHMAISDVRRRDRMPWGSPTSHPNFDVVRPVYAVIAALREDALQFRAGVHQDLSLPLAAYEWCKATAEHSLSTTLIDLLDELIRCDYTGAMHRTIGDDLKTLGKLGFGKADIEAALNRKQY